MKTKVCMIAVMMMGLAAAQAAEVDLTVDFASAYVFRGVTLNRDAVMQPGLEVTGLPIAERFGEFAVGTWANFDLSSGGSDYGLAQNQFSEIDYYGDYSLPLEVVDLGMVYTEYTYPNSEDSADRELAVYVGKDVLDTGLYVEASANYGLAGGVTKDWYLQAGLEYGVDLLPNVLSASVGAGVGYLVQDDGPNGWHDGIFSADLGYALAENLSVNLALMHIVQLDSDVLMDENYDRSTVGMAGLNLSF